MSDADSPMDDLFPKTIAALRAGIRRQVRRWRRCPIPVGSDWSEIASDPNDPDHWLLRAPDRLIETLDAGATWRPVDETG